MKEKSSFQREKVLEVKDNQEEKRNLAIKEGFVFDENDKNKLIKYNGKSSKVIIPDFVTSIEKEAFFRLDFLTTVFIPSSVTCINVYAFYECNSVVIYCETSSQSSNWCPLWNGFRPVYWNVTQEDIIYLDGLQYLIIDGNAVITGITKKLSNNVVIPSTITVNGTTYKITSIGYFAYGYCRILTSIAIPNSITSIGVSAFHECSSLTSINIPCSVINIGKGAFLLCKSLTSIAIPSSVTSIEDHTFFECKSLYSVEISSGIICIGKEAFTKCSSLTSIVIPRSVTSIECFAFSCCDLLNIYCEVSSKPSGWDIIWNVDKRPVYWSNQWSYVDGVPTPNN